MTIAFAPSFVTLKTTRTCSSSPCFGNSSTEGCTVGFDVTFARVQIQQPSLVAAHLRTRVRLALDQGDLFVQAILIENRGATNFDLRDARQRVLLRR